MPLCARLLARIIPHSAFVITNSEPRTQNSEHSIPFPTRNPKRATRNFIPHSSFLIPHSPLTTFYSPLPTHHFPLATDYFPLTTSHLQLTPLPLPHLPPYPLLYRTACPIFDTGASSVDSHLGTGYRMGINGVSMGEYSMKTTHRSSPMLLVRHRQ